MKKFGVVAGFIIGVSVMVYFILNRKGACSCDGQGCKNPDMAQSHY